MTYLQGFAKVRAKISPSKPMRVRSFSAKFLYPPRKQKQPSFEDCFFRQFSLFCLVITSCNVKGYAAFHKTSTADAVPEVFCSLATSRSEKVPFSAVSTNLVSLRETGSLIPLPVPKAKTALFRGLFLSFGVGKGIRTFDLQCHKLAL